MPIVEGATVPVIMPYVRTSVDGRHSAVIDLRMNGRVRCICMRCWHSWPEGGDPSDCSPVRSDLMAILSPEEREAVLVAAFRIEAMQVIDLPLVQQLRRIAGPDRDAINAEQVAKVAADLCAEPVKNSWLGGVG